MRDKLRTFIRWLKSYIQNASLKLDGKWAYIVSAVIALILFVGGIYLFLELTEDLQETYLSDNDASVSAYITSHRSAALTEYFVFVTNLGDALGYLIVSIVCTIIFYFAFKRWQYVAQLAFVMVLALSSNLILKQIINRARPGVEHLVTVKTLSYPSGHAMMAMAFYGTLIYLVSKFPIRKILKAGLILIFIVLIISIGVSRIYLGVHYPSDIAGGFIGGFVWVVFCVIIFQLIQVFKRDPAT